MAAKQRFLVVNGLDNNSKTIVNVADPVNNTDAVTKQFSSNATNLTSGTIPSARLPIVTSEDTATGYLTYSGTTSTAGQLNGGTTNPSSTKRLNYNGKFYSSNLALTGTGIGAINSPSLRFNHDSGGTLAARNVADTAYGFLAIVGNAIELSINDTPTLKVLPASIEMKALTSFENNINVTATSKLVINSVLPTDGQVLTATATGMVWQTPATSSGVTSGSASTGYLTYSGTTSTAGQLNGGTTNPSANTRLNYNGDMYVHALHVTDATVSLLRLSGSNGATVEVKNAANTDYAFMALNGSIVSLGTKRATANAVTELVKLEGDVATLLGGLTHVTATLTTTTVTANQVVDTASASLVRTVKYIVQAVSGTSYQATELLMIHDGTTAHLTEYASIATGATLASYDVDISGGNVRLLVTPVNASTTIKVSRTAINL